MQSGPAVENQAPLQVEPLEGWNLLSPRGLLRVGDKPNDRLVRFTTIARWLVVERGMPLSVAVQTILDGINMGSILDIYEINISKEPSPAIEPHPYIYFLEGIGSLPYPENIIQYCKFGLNYLLTEPEKLESKVNRSVRRYDRTKETPLDYFERVGASDEYAIRISKAYELWGWGRVAGEQANAPRLRTFADLVAYRKTAAGLEWTPEQRAILAAEYQQPGMSMTKLAQALNVSRQAIKVQIDKHAAGELGKRERGKQKGNHANIVAFPLKAVNARQ